MPENLKAKVVQPLLLNEKGVTSYMTVDAGSTKYRIIPVPNVAGLYSQLSAKQGESISLKPIGRSGDIFWASLLDVREAEFGFPIDYSNLSSRPQMFYVASNQDFPRSTELTIDRVKPQKNSMNIHILGRNYDIRYSGEVFDAAASFNGLSEFQGFAARLWTPDNNALFKIWMRLTPADILGAAKNENYHGLKNLFSGRWSFTEAPGFNRANLEGMLKDYATQKAADAELPKAVKLTLTPYNGGPIAVEVRPGTYTINDLVSGLTAIVAGQGTRQRDVVADYTRHVMGNLPLTINEAQYSRTQQITIVPGTGYSFRITKPVTQTPPAAPPRLPAEDSTRTATNRAAPPVIETHRDVTRRDVGRNTTPAFSGRQDAAPPAQKKPHVDVERREEREASERRHRAPAAGG